MNFDVPYGITRRISGTTIAATRVSAASPRAMFAVVGDAAAEGITAIAEDAEGRLRRALDRLVAGAGAKP